MMAPDFVAISGVFKTSLTMKNAYPEQSHRWWIDNYLPEPYRTQALKNCKLKRNLTTAKSLHNALIEAFTWINTPKKQGHFYWDSIYRRAKSGEFNQHQP